MNSINFCQPVPYVPGAYVPLMRIHGGVPAGFPSPAEDFAVKRHDLNELLITHPVATFLLGVRGLSMIKFGIFDGDIVVVNRAIPAKHLRIVVAEIDGEFTIKQYWSKNGQIQLRTGNPTFPTILLKDGQTLTIFGTVTAAIKQFG